MIFLAVAGPTPGSSSSSSAVALFRSMVAVAAAFSLAVVFWGAVCAWMATPVKTTNAPIKGNDRELRENREFHVSRPFETEVRAGRRKADA